MKAGVPSQLDRPNLLSACPYDVLADEFLQALGTLGIAGTIPVLWSLRLTWAHRRWWASRVWSIALAVSSLAIVWFAVVFHLITIDLSY